MQARANLASSSCSISYERDGERGFDCSPVIDADGTLLGRTRMIHITDYPCFHEQGYYTPGDTGAPVYRDRGGRASASPSATTGTIPSTCARSRSAVQISWSCRRPGAVDEWPEGLYEAEMRVAAFQHGYFVALCNRVGGEECLTFAGESFVCAPDGHVVARAPRLEDFVLTADIDLRQAAASHARRLFLRHRRPELYAEWALAGR